MFHADEMPLLSWGAVDVSKMGNNLWKVTVEVTNEKIIPSRTAMAAKHHIGSPDIFTCSTSNASTVAASGTTQGILKTAKLNRIESENPERIIVNQGIKGNGSTLFQFIVQGYGNLELKYVAEKGGTLQKTIQLKEQFVPKKNTHKRAIPSPGS